MKTFSPEDNELYRRIDEDKWGQSIFIVTPISR